jgi:spermidine synthase
MVLLSRPSTTFIALLIPVAAVILLPVALLGVGLPAIIAAAARGAPSLRSVAGRLAFWNTLGSAAGGLAAGYALLPGLGLRGCFSALAVLSVALGVASEWRSGVGERARWGHLLRPGTLGAAALLTSRSGPATTSPADAGHYEGSGFSGERPPHRRRGGPCHHRLRPGRTAEHEPGRRERETGSGAATGSLAGAAGYILALFIPGGWRSRAGIALGSGQTFGALLRTPVKRMDVVDISGEVVELALRYFAPFNDPLGSDPRVTFHLDDGRHFIDRASGGSYDVVSLEPPPPTNENVYRLYSLEFYQGVRRILRDGGVLVQWLPLNLVTRATCAGCSRPRPRSFPSRSSSRTGRWTWRC